MTKLTQVECPVCGRVVAFVAGATNASGEPIMSRHWRADILAWQWCDGSSLSVTVAFRNHLRALGAAGNAERRAARKAKRSK